MGWQHTGRGASRSRAAWCQLEASPGQGCVLDPRFYFTIRDSLNFGNAEQFGVIEQCHMGECKLRSPGFNATYTTTSSSTAVSDGPSSSSTSGTVEGSKETTSTTTSAMMGSETTSEGEESEAELTDLGSRSSLSLYSFLLSFLAVRCDW